MAILDFDLLEVPKKGFFPRGRPPFSAFAMKSASNCPMKLLEMKWVDQWRH